MRILVVLLFFFCVKTEIVLAQININLDLTSNNKVQKNKKDQWYQSRPKGFEFVPSGSYQDTIFINNDTVIRTISLGPFWMSNEITNKEFREFTTYLSIHPEDSLCYHDFSNAKNNDKNIIEKAKNYVCFSNKAIAKDILDSNRFKTQNPELADYYYNKKYNDHPVVGVSFDGARFYSIWKTKTEKSAHKANYRMNDYRIPVEDEYKYIISKTKDKNWQVNNSLNKINSGIKNYYNLYNLCSNASEWAYKNSDDSKKGPTVIKGSWTPNIKSNEITEYDFVGFRLVSSYLSDTTKH